MKLCIFGGMRQIDILLKSFSTNQRVWKWSLPMPKDRNAKHFLGVYRLHYAQPGKTFSLV